MAFSLSRVAGAGLRRMATPVAGPGPSFFGKTSYRRSIRPSDLPLKKIEDFFNGWSAEELTWARSVIDAKLADKGLAILSTGKDARVESAFRALTTELSLMRREMTGIKNKKGDIAAIPMGKNGATINLLSVVTVWMKAEELWPMLPAIQAWIKRVLG